MLGRDLTAGLTLINADSKALRLLSEQPEAFEKEYSLSIAPDYNAFPEALIYVARLLESGAVDPRWWMYFFVLREESLLVGIGGFKGEPGKEGAVEIGYGIAPAFQGKGLATRAAGMLVEIARRDARVNLIRAHTLPGFGPSAKVLQKNGFTLIGEKIDPDDGAVWRWERPAKLT